MTGATETGKSTLARAIFLSAAAPRLVIDPADSTLTEIRGAPTFSDPRRWPDAATVRFVPRDPADLDAYDALWRQVFTRRYPIYVWVDEGGMVLPVRGGGRWGRAAVVQGAKRMVGVLVCHTRPRAVLVEALGMAAHVMIFELPSIDDRRHVADTIGVAVGVLDDALSRCGPHGFVWWNRPARTLTVCPALQT